MSEVRDELVKIMPDVVKAAGIYQHDKSLVVPHAVMREGFLRPDGTPEMVPTLEFGDVSPSRLVLEVDRIAEFFKDRKAKDGTWYEQTTNAPANVVKAIHTSPDLWHGLPVVHRLAQVPLYFGDKLITATGLHNNVYAAPPAGVTLPSELSKSVATSALKRLKIWLEEFPFEVKKRDETAALALLLTAAMRPSLGQAPMFRITKVNNGCGGTTLAKAAGIVLTGRAPPVLGASKSREESEKRLVTALMAGRAIVVLDNLPAGEVYDSELLAQALSEREAQLRVFGETRDVTVDTGQLFIATGVNIGLSTELGRRAVTIRLNPQTEHPEERPFKRPEMLEELKRTRSSVLSDLYTIVACYLASGERASVLGLAGYDAWARACVEPLKWLGCGDAIEETREPEGKDEKREAHARILEVWRDTQGDSAKGLTVRAALGSSKELKMLLADNFCDHWDAPDGNPDVSPRDVGRWLSRVEGTPIAGLRFERVTNAPNSKNGLRWIVKISTPATDWRTTERRIRVATGKGAGRSRDGGRGSVCTLRKQKDLHHG